MNILPFTPASAGTVSRTVTGTSASVALAFPSSQQVMVTSPAGNTIAFIEFGTSGVAAVAATGTPIQPGSIMVFTVSASTTHVAAIGTSGTTLYFTSGMGS